MSRKKVLNILESTEVVYPIIASLFFSHYLLLDLCSNQEEAGIMIAIDALHFLNRSEILTIIIRSPSGGTDNLMLILAHLCGRRKKSY